MSLHDDNWWKPLHDDAWWKESWLSKSGDRERAIQDGRDQFSGARARHLANHRESLGLGTIKYTAYSPEGELLGEFENEELAHGALQLKRFERDNPDHYLEKIDDYNYKMRRRSDLPAET